MGYWDINWDIIIIRSGTHKYVPLVRVNIFFLKKRGASPPNSSTEYILLF